MYYRGSQAAIVVYDITNADTFARAKTWVKELQVRGVDISDTAAHFIQRQASPNIVIALAGNKADLGGKSDPKSKRAVEYSVRFMLPTRPCPHSARRRQRHMLRRTVYCLWRHRQRPPSM